MRPAKRARNAAPGPFQLATDMRGAAEEARLAGIRRQQEEAARQEAQFKVGGSVARWVGGSEAGSQDVRAPQLQQPVWQAGRQAGRFSALTVSSVGTTCAHPTGARD